MPKWDKIVGQNVDQIDANNSYRDNLNKFNNCGILGYNRKSCQDAQTTNQQTSGTTIAQDCGPHAT